RCDLSSFHKNLFIERNAHRLSRLAFPWRRIDIERLDGMNISPLIRRRKHEMVPDLHPSCHHPAGDDATRVKFIDVLDGKSQWLLRSRRFFMEKAQSIQDRRSTVPGHSSAWVGDIVTEFRANGNNPFRNGLELLKELPIFLLNPMKHVLTISD